MRILNDPAFDSSFDQLWDLQGVSTLEVTNETLQSLAQARSYSSEAKRAIVAPRDILFGMARMFQMLHDGAPEDLRVFRTVEEANDWLGLG